MRGLVSQLKNVSPACHLMLPAWQHGDRYVEARGARRGDAWASESTQECVVSMPPHTSCLAAEGQIRGNMRGGTCTVGHARWDMRGGEMGGGKMSGGEMSGGEMSGGEMSGGEMSGGEMSGGKMSGGKMSGGKMSGGKMSGGKMSGGKMSGGKMSGGKMSGGKMSGGKMSGGKMSGGKMSGGKMSGGKMSGGKMSGGKMSGGKMSGGKRWMVGRDEWWPFHSTQDVSQARHPRAYCLVAWEGG
ncbi:unnamed protein product [Closterium sp. Yama58-4]|nr:unnamed protein product [Closterium sp. Yama58-4]